MNFRAVLPVLAAALTSACAAPSPAGRDPADGPLTLDVLEVKVDRWIAAERGG
jgi:hypothetical protein